MKARIACFGHGWSLETSGTTYYVGSFGECIILFDSLWGAIAAKALQDSCTMKRLGLQSTGTA
jgi:hypothetical protein